MFIASVSPYHSSLNSKKSVSFEGKKASAVAGALMSLTAAAHGNTLLNSKHFLPITEFCTEPSMRLYAKDRFSPCPLACAEVIKLADQGVQVPSEVKARLGRQVETYCRPIYEGKYSLYWIYKDKKQVKTK